MPPLMKPVLAITTIVALATAPAFANVSETVIIRKIEKDGYSVIHTETTWLGRRRVLSVSGDNLREVVIGPGTGEILRDVVYEIPGLAAMIRLTEKKGGRKTIDLSDVGGPLSTDVTEVGDNELVSAPDAAPYDYSDGATTTPDVLGTDKPEAPLTSGSYTPETLD